MKIQPVKMREICQCDECGRDIAAGEFAYIVTVPAGIAFCSYAHAASHIEAAGDLIELLRLQGIEVTV